MAEDLPGTEGQRSPPQLPDAALRTPEMLVRSGRMRVLTGASPSTLLRHGEAFIFGQFVEGKEARKQQYEWQVDHGHECVEIVGHGIAPQLRPQAPERLATILANVKLLHGVAAF